MNLNDSTTFYIYSISIAIGPIGCLIYLLLQLLTQYQKTDKYATKPEIFRLLMIAYILGIICGLMGLSLHTAKNSGLFCISYGMAICFSFLGGGKTVMYYIFTRFAKITNGDSMISDRKRIILDIIAPIYIITHWLCYVFGASVLFRGEMVTPFEGNVSFCVWIEDEKQTYFLIAASVWDLCNCAIFLYIFIEPLCKIMRHMDTSQCMEADKAQRTKERYISIMKWNVVLSFIATLSSFFSICIAIMYKNAVWGSCLGDPFVNSSCAYFMLKNNRDFCSFVCCNLYTCQCETKDEIIATKMAMTTCASAESNV